MLQLLRLVSVSLGGLPESEARRMLGDGVTHGNQSQSAGDGEARYDVENGKIFLLLYYMLARSY